MALTQISTEGIKNGTITNADIGSSAAIAGTKISPDFGSQAITTKASAVDTDIFSIIRQDSSSTKLFRIFQDSSSGGGAGGCHINTTNRNLMITANTSAGSDDGLYLTTTGRLGIGTTSPSDELTLRGSQFQTTQISIGDNGDRLRIGYAHSDGLASSTTASQIVSTAGSDLFIAPASNAASEIVFFSNSSSGAPTEHMRLKSDGDLLLTRQTAGGGNETLLITGNYGSGSDQALQASNSLRFYTNGANERLRIASNGRIGKGTTSPTTDFDVIRTNSSLTDVMLVKGNSGNGFIRFQDNDSSCNFTLGADAGSGTGDNSFVLYDRVNSAYRWSIDNSGNMKVWSGDVEVTAGKVGIGTSSPSAKLQVHNTGTPDSQLLRLVNTQHDTNAASSAQLKFGITNSLGERNARIEAKETVGNTNDVALDFYTNTASSTDGETIKMRIAAAGNVGIGTTSPVNNSGYGGITLNGGSGAIFSFKDSDVEKTRLALVANDIFAVQYPPGSSGHFRIDSLTADGSGNITGSIERMRINSSGNLLLGTTSISGTSAQARDIVIGSIGDGTHRGITFATTGQAAIRWADAADNAQGRIQYSNSTDLMTFHTDNFQCASLDSSGHVTLGRDYSTNPSNVLTGVTTIRGHAVNTGTTDNDFAQLYLKNSTVGGGSSASIRGYREDSNYSTGLRFYTHGNPNSGGDGDERMRIDSTGRVLIGTTENVVSRLYVTGGSFSLTGSDANFGGGGNRVFLDHDNNDVRFGFTGGGGSNTTKGLRFYTVNNHNGTANHNRITPIGEFRITHGGGSSGSVSTDFVNGIGETALDTVQSNLARLVMQERTSNWISLKDGSGTHYGTIARSGSGVSYGSNSDYRLKDNVANLTGGIALVKQLRPVTFNWNDLSGLSKTETHQGFIAHEVQALVSDAVEGEKDGMDIWGDCTDSEGNVTQTHVPESKKKDGETWTKKGEDIHDQQLDPGKLIPILTAAIKSLISKVEVLETEVAGLKAA